MIKIAPSILSADFAKLGQDVDECLQGGADYIHFDVMDGEFVPNISIGIPVLKSLRKHTDGFIDVHLMIDRPVRYVETFVNAGADLLTFHVESDSEENIMAAVRKTKELGKKAGLSVKPKTPADALYPYMELLDLVLVMTVEPGFGGQSFMADMLPKIDTLAKYIEEHHLDCELEVDGGMEGLGCLSYDFCSEHIESISAWEILQTGKLRQNESYYYPFKAACLSLGLPEQVFDHFLDYQIMTDYLLSNTDRHMNNIALTRDLPMQSSRPEKMSIAARYART